MYDIKFWLMINLGWQADLTVYVLSFEKKISLSWKQKSALGRWCNSHTVYILDVSLF